jgi:hypothetical protein
MSKVYIVFGTTGEYSDRNEWSVCGYRNKDIATKHADDAMIWAHLLKEKIDEEGKSAFEAKDQLVSPYDSHFNMDYTGTDYYVLEVDIIDE